MIIQRSISGFLIALVNGLSLPVLFVLDLLIVDILRDIHNVRNWYGPICFIELYFIFFGFGLVCSLIPAILATNILSVGINFFNMGGKKRTTWLYLGVGIGIGVAVAVSYMFLLFSLGIGFSSQDHMLLAMLALVENILIYSWLAHRWAMKCHFNEPA
jgi:hypothetical protein